MVELESNHVGLEFTSLSNQARKIRIEREREAGARGVFGMLKPKEKH